jgi:archaetidylinositol phosphate synthase
MSDARRELTFLLAEPEKRLLRGIAERLPRRVTSDTLTVIGIIGAVLTGAAFALSTLHPAWLFAVPPLLAVNWFGDSLDGTLARVRHHERPKYGYYLDHIVDAFATAAIGIGIGLSPFVQLEVALLLVVGYLGLSINVYLESAVMSVFRLAYGRIGPTETRILLGLAASLLGGTALAGAGTQGLTLIANGVALALAAAMLLMLGWRCAGNLRKLAAIEPRPRWKSEVGEVGEVGNV